MNLVRITFHPDGLAPRILNLGELRAHFIARLRRQERITANASLGKLIDEVQSYAGTSIESDPELASAGVIPVRMQVDGEVMSFFTTVTSFGAPVDVTVSELSIEMFHPIDETVEGVASI